LIRPRQRYEKEEGKEGNARKFTALVKKLWRGGQLREKSEM